MRLTSRPMTLIHRELRKTVKARIVVAFDYEPCWCVAHADVEKLAVDDQVVEAVHELWD